MQLIHAAKSQAYISNYNCTMKILQNETTQTIEVDKGES